VRGDEVVVDPGSTSVRPLPHGSLWVSDEQVDRRRR